MKYHDFIQTKRLIHPESGFESDFTNKHAFDFQSAAIRWGLQKGRALVALDTGLGKTICQLDILDQVCQRYDCRCLLLCPLAVASQTLGESSKFGVQSSAKIVADQSEVNGAGIYLTNYEKLHKFDPTKFGAVGLDEGSILKSLSGKIRTQLIGMFSEVPYRFVFTATPSPNDVMEIGNYAEFLGIMSRAEMLAMFFVHDGGETSKWKLKGHAKTRFYEWLASWCLMARSPEDLGFDGSRFELPPLKTHEHITDSLDVPVGYLFQIEALTLADQRQSRRDSLGSRVGKLAEIVNGTSQPFLVWCELNDESSAAADQIPDAVELTGNMKAEQKEQAIRQFLSGEKRVLISKPKICGFGLNFQHCSNVAFLGVSHSFEATYQAIRRCWRFGQSETVDVHLVLSDREGSVRKNLLRKQDQHDQLVAGVVSAMKASAFSEVQHIRGQEPYVPTQPITLPPFLKDKNHA